MAAGNGRVVVEGVGLSKSYGPITALDQVDINIRAGEITALVGDNGAGKSTLIKILAGAVTPDEGEVRINGERVTLRSPADARDLGIETIFQDLALAPDRDVVTNLFLGREVVRKGLAGKLGMLDRGAMAARASSQIESLGVNIPRSTGVPIGQMSGGQQQSVAVARAAFWAETAMFMDEPTAALGVRESSRVLQLARQIAARGVAVVLISHILPHVMELADRVVVLRHGQKVAELTEDITMDRLVTLIVGVGTHDAAD